MMLTFVINRGSEEYKRNKSGHRYHENALTFDLDYVIGVIDVIGVAMLRYHF